MAGDTYFTTGTTNFDKTVVPLIEKQILANLRAGLPWTPAGSVIPGTFVKGSNGEFRAVAYGDLVEGGEVDLEDADPDPDIESMDIDYVTFTGERVGRVLGLSDNSQERSPHNLMAVAADKVARAASVMVDNVVRALYAAATPDVFGGTSKDAIDEIALGDNFTAKLLKDMVALARFSNIKPLKSGLYAFVADSLVIRDLQEDDDYKEEIQHANPQSLLTGQIGQYAGAAIIDAGSRGIVHSGAGTGSVDVHQPTLIGADAVFAGLGDLQIKTAVGPDKADPLGRRDTIGYKSFIGGVLNDAENEYRFVSAAVATSL